MNIRTDLALEGVSSAKVHEGISQTRRGKAFRITEICIKEENTASLSVREKAGTLPLREKP